MLKVKPDFCTTHIQKFATASFLFDLKLLKGSIKYWDQEVFTYKL